MEDKEDMVAEFLRFFRWQIANRKDIVRYPADHRAVIVRFLNIGRWPSEHRSVIGRLSTEHRTMSSDCTPVKYRWPISSFVRKHMSAGHRPMIDRGPEPTPITHRSFHFFLRCSDVAGIFRCPDIVRRPEGMWLSHNSASHQAPNYVQSS